MTLKLNAHAPSRGRRHLPPTPLAAPRSPSPPARALTFVPQADLSVLDPIWTTAYGQRATTASWCSTRCSARTRIQASPQMAEGASAEADGKTWTIKLRSGLLFHDKTPVLARDCVASLQALGQARRLRPGADGGHR